MIGLFQEIDIVGEKGKGVLQQTSGIFWSSGLPIDTARGRGIYLPREEDCVSCGFGDTKNFR